MNSGWPGTMASRFQLPPMAFVMARWRMPRSRLVRRRDVELVDPRLHGVGEPACRGSPIEILGKEGNIQLDGVVFQTVVLAPVSNRGYIALGRSS